MQADRIGGYASRSVSGALPGEQTSEYRTALVFGGISTGAEWSNSGSKLARGITGINEVYLHQLQYNTISGVVSGNGFCRFRLKVAQQEIMQGVTFSNLSGITETGFVVLLDNATGTITFNPPVRIFHYKDGRSEWTQNSNVEVGIQDDTGAPRSATKIIMNLIVKSRYFQ